MATLKTVLDTRRAKADGTYPLYIRITHNSQTRSIALNAYLLPQQWDENKQIVKRNYENSKSLNLKIKKKILEMVMKMVPPKVGKNQTYPNTHLGIRLSMDGKGRAIDNIFIERFWRSLKYEQVYLYPASDGIECYKGIQKYMSYYNFERRHQSLEDQFPAQIFKDYSQAAA